MKRMVMLTSLFLLFLSGLSFSAQLYPVVEVKDGDSIVVLYRGKNEEVHLIGVKAPEIARPPVAPPSPWETRPRRSPTTSSPGKRCASCLRKTSGTRTEC